MIGSRSPFSSAFFPSSSFSNRLSHLFSYSTNYLQLKHLKFNYLDFYLLYKYLRFFNHKKNKAENKVNKHQSGNPAIGKAVNLFDKFAI